MTLDRRDDVDRAIYLYGTHEWASTRLFELIVTPGVSVIDVGAHAGFYSLLAARLGAEVLAFEPNPATRARLLNNVASVQAIRVEPYALADFDGDARLDPGEPQNVGTARLSVDGTVNVAVRRLDAFLEGGSPTEVRLVKLDVEGAESQVLQGALEMLDRCRPVVVFEAHPSLSNTERTMSTLRSRGYSIFSMAVGRLGGVSLVEVASGTDLRTIAPRFEALNLVGVHPGLRPRLSARLFRRAS